MKIATHLLLPLLLLLGAGCATITSGSTQQISFQSVPDDAVVTLIRMVPNPEAYHGGKSRTGGPVLPPIQETRVLGKTPFTLQLDRADGQTVTFSKAGYTPMSVPLSTGTNPAVWGNILIGGLFGTTTDSMSGAIYEYVPNQYLITLHPLQTSAIEHSQGLSPQDAARRFLIHRYPALMSDLSRGMGEDLRAVFTVLRVPPQHEADTQVALVALAQRHPDVGAFATEVARRYLRE